MQFARAQVHKGVHELRSTSSGPQVEIHKLRLPWDLPLNPLGSQGGSLGILECPQGTHLLSSLLGQNTHFCHPCLDKTSMFGHPCLDKTLIFAKLVFALCPLSSLLTLHFYLLSICCVWQCLFECSDLTMYLLRLAIRRPSPFSPCLQPGYRGSGPLEMCM